MSHAVSIFRNNRCEAIRLATDFEKQVDTSLPHPVRPNWLFFLDGDRGPTDFLHERPDLIEEGRFSINDNASA